MGHVTVTAENLEEAIALARHVQGVLKVVTQ
jgi:osmotically-inducible protein OsmY